MSFGGSVAAMLASIKNNKRSKTSTYEKIEKYQKNSKIQLHFDKKTTNKELLVIRKRLKKENRAIRTKQIIIFIITLSILLYLVY